VDNQLHHDKKSLRATDVDRAVELVRERQRPDGLWAAGGHWWRRPGSRTLAEVVDWGRRGASEMITLTALRVLRATPYS
jgi:hypothetical protein